MIIKMICNYQIIKEATNFKGKEVNLIIKGIAKVFKLPSIGILTRRKEGYSTTIVKYFIGGEEETLYPLFSLCDLQSQWTIKGHET
jgi:hypothetical protein